MKQSENYSCTQLNITSLGDVVSPLSNASTLWCVNLPVSLRN